MVHAGSRSQLAVVAMWLVSLATFAVILHAHDQHLAERERATTSALASLQTQIARMADAPPSCAAPIVQPLVDVDALASLTAAAVRRASPSGAQAAAAPETNPTPEQAAAIGRAQAALDGALRRGTLARTDMAEIRRNLASSSPEDANDLRRSLAVAINTSRLKIEPHVGPP